MSRAAWRTSSPVLVEVGHDVVRVLHGGVVREWPLERDGDGRVAAATRNRLQQELPGFLARAAWQPKQQAWCALGARGVSVRRLALPEGGPGTSLEAMVAMQVEAEFPLPLDQLAWGYVRLGGGGARREVLVVALKREVVDDYRRLFEACGLQPRFTLAALARAHGVASQGALALLAIEARTSEWAEFDALGLQRVRALPWGVARLELDYAAHAGIDAETARAALREWAISGDSHREIDATLARALADVAGENPAVRAAVVSVALPAGTLAAALSRALPRPGGWTVLAGGIEAPEKVVRGLESAWREGAMEAFPELHVPAREAHPVLSHGVPWKWVGAAAALLLLVTVAPHLEVGWLKPGLERRLASLKADESKLVRLEAQWDFMRRLKQSQPPYLDALIVINKSIAPGSQLESVSMNARGDLVMRGTLRTSQDVVGFRSKLVESGFFATVVVDEQNPTPNRQQVNYRITARWTDSAERDRLPILALEAPPTNAPVTTVAAGPKR